MNEHQPEPGARHRAEGPTIDDLPVSSESRTIRALWKTGLSQWGDAFVAYTRLSTIELHTPEVLAAFEDAYVTSLESYDALVEDHLEGMGWRQPLKELRDKYAIPEELLDWNRPAVLSAFKEFMEVVEEGDRVHVFLR
jgi:hypothetical protein